MIELPSSQFHFILLSLLLFIATLVNIYFSIFFGCYLLYLYKHKTLFIYSIAIIVLCFVSIQLTPKQLSSESFYGTVVLIEESNYTNKLTLKVDNNNVIVYLKKTIDINVGDYGYFNCSKSEFSSSTYNGSFDYNKYLYDSYIDGVYFASDYTFVENKFTLSKVHYNIKEYFENNLSNQTLKYSLMLILGVDSFDEAEEEIVSNLGIMHLFCISGMHINFILLMVGLILKKLYISDDKIELIQVLFAVMLLIITNFQISVIRAFLMFLITFICKKNKLKVTSLDVLCVSAIIILIIRPRYFNLISFRLTYLVTFILILTSDLYKNKSMINTLVMQSIIAFCITLPIIININYEINLMTFVNSTFISIPFSYCIMPLTFISAIFKTNFFNSIFVLFDTLLFDFNRIDLFIFNVSKLNMFSIAIYYLLFFLILRSIYTKKHLNKLITTMILLLLVILNVTKLNNETRVTFFDVGQGDSSLITLPYNQGNILIDCFGGVSNFIKTRGITDIDYLIITHAHNDHMGDLEIVKEEFNVKTTIGSLHDPDSIELGLDRYVEANDRIIINDFVINFIAPYESHSDINRASLVFTIEIHDYVFMYTGDTTKEVEEQILHLDLKSDVLKVPHHGSNTSSSVEFVEAVYPTYSIFSYGASNSYGLPNNEIVSRYYMSENYHTPIHKTIEFYYVTEWKIRTYNEPTKKYLFL
ncbi:MAG: ComEC/Rec2 family competence protein [bacterium]